MTRGDDTIQRTGTIQNVDNVPSSTEVVVNFPPSSDHQTTKVWLRFPVEKFGLVPLDSTFTYPIDVSFRELVSEFEHNRVISEVNNSFERHYPVVGKWVWPLIFIFGSFSLIFGFADGAFLRIILDLFFEFGLLLLLLFFISIAIFFGLVTYDSRKEAEGLQKVSDDLEKVQKEIFLTNRAVNYRFEKEGSSVFLLIEQFSDEASEKSLLLSGTSTTSPTFDI